MMLTRVIAFTLVSVVMLLLLKKQGSTVGVILEIGVIVALLLSGVPEMKELFLSLESLCKNTVNAEGVLKGMLKAFGILTLGGFVADICRDNSENALGGIVELLVKILAFISVMPTFTAVVVTALTLLEK